MCNEMRYGADIAYPHFVNSGVFCFLIIQVVYFSHDANTVYHTAKLLVQFQINPIVIGTICNSTCNALVETKVYTYLRVEARTRKTKHSLFIPFAVLSAVERMDACAGMLYRITDMSCGTA